VCHDALGDGSLTGHHRVSGTRESAAIGLFRGADLAGVLMLGSETPLAFAAVDRSVLERVGVHLSLAAHNARLYQEIKALHLSNLKGLSTALNAKDYYTLGHAARVAAYIVLLGEELGWDEESVDLVRDAAYLHDIGKIGVSDRVLLKQGPLNPEEWQLMRQHPALSADIIRPLFPPALVDAVKHHHERFDGGGYPDGLKGLAIPELARAMCVVDSYDAMSLQRPYREALGAEECLAELERCSERQFDPAMVTAFRRVLKRLARLRRVAEGAAVEAAARLDPAAHARLQQACDVGSESYARVQAALRSVREAHPEVRFMTTQALRDQQCVIVVDAEETG
jgi:putative nucleotidyltransferase with HDIG domain